MQLRIASLSDRGRARELNEDAVLTDAPLVAIADGMGGHEGGEVASNLALETLANWKDRLAGLEGTAATETLREAFADANRTVWEKGQREQELLGMGTTLTAAWIDSGSVAIAHVGDSRAYLLRDGKLQQLTEDQNVARDWVKRGRLSEDEAASSPQRHIILQAIGPDPSGLDTAVSTVALREGDRLVLASDGLFGMVREPDVIRDLLIEHEDPDVVCRALIDRANEAGGEDNISVVVVDVITADGATETDADLEPIAVAKPSADERPRRSPRTRRYAIAGGAVALVAIVAGALLVSRATTNTLLVSQHDGKVAILKGKVGTEDRPAEGRVVRVFDELPVSRFSRPSQRELRIGIPAQSLAEAERIIDTLPRRLGPRDTPTPTPQSPEASASPGADETLPAASP